ncbi:MAG TPA: nuclear transport factor 2 family protein [Acidimicrobiales bacterium]|nr:nuclear transport factor 2 family protein [Acidimicrobiales bacterium]
MTDTTTTLEQRLGRLEDLQAIHQLFIDYGHHLDSGDFASYAELFADEGEIMLGPMGRAKGRSEIEALMTKTLGGRPGQSFHLITSPVVELNGDRATSEVMWTVLSRGDGGPPVVTMLGRHKDDLVREGGRWKFLRRRGFVDIPSTYED